MAKLRRINPPRDWFLVASFTADRNGHYYSIDPLIRADQAQVSCLNQFPLYEPVAIAKGDRVVVHLSVTRNRARLVVDKGSIADVYYAFDAFQQKPVSEI